jgi:hypothetical protein
MGGMFTVVKVREGLAANDYKDPGWYKFPKGTVAYEVSESRAGIPERRTEAPTGKSAVEVTVVKPGSMGGQNGRH